MHPSGCPGRVLRGHPAADSRRSGGTGLQPALAPVRAGVRRPAAGAVPARSAVLQGGRPGLLPPALRHQRHAHPASAAGRPISGRSPRAGSTGSTTGCCSGQMSTPRSTAVTSAWTRSTACWSARACGRTSATATSSTPKPGGSSTCLNDGPTGLARSSWNGTSTRSSSGRPQPDLAQQAARPTRGRGWL
jgi:hypothetical protein